MATDYCDPWTYAQVYGHEPPTDGSRDLALGDPDEALSTTGIDSEVTTKVVTPPEPEQPATSEIAETK